MERTYVFNQDGNNGNGGGSKFDIMAMLPNLMGSKGVDPGLLALLNQGRGSQDQWGGSWWFIWIILLWFCWGGNGFGNRFGNGGGLPAELNGDVGREYLMSAIQGNGNAINQLASSLNCSTQQLQSALCNIQGLIANGCYLIVIHILAATAVKQQSTFYELYKNRLYAGFVIFPPL